MGALPPVVLPMPAPGEVSSLDVAPYAGDVCYFEAGDDYHHLATTYWSAFWQMGGRAAVDELLAAWKVRGDQQE
jgi:catechol-2,3-dioxygenase